MKTRQLATGLVLFGVTLSATLATAREDRLSVALAWRPTADVNDLPSVFNPDRWRRDEHTRDLPPPETFDGSRFQVLPFADKRTEKNLGSNNEERWPRPVTTNDDVAAFVTGHLGEVLQSAHVRVTDSGANRILKGEVVSFFVNEDNTYNGSVLLSVTLTDSRGKELWQGMANGRARRFGHSLSEENYNETLSDGLVDAVSDLLKNPGFQRAARAK